jgi:hypothetical protein
MLSMNHYVIDQLIDNDVARLKRLGEQRSSLLRELQRVDSAIQETSDHLVQVHNEQYLYRSFR